MGTLSGKTVLITGASSGIGLSMAELFAEEGSSLSLLDIDFTSSKNLEERFRRNKVNSFFFTGDVSKPADCEKWIISSIDQFKKVDVLINNAGIMDDFMPLDKVSDQQWDRVIGVNLNGPFFLTRKIIPFFIQQSKGVILNIASVGGIFGARAGAVYTASKHALVGLTKNIAFMYAMKGIRCNAIAPGGINTSISLHMNPDPFGYERCVSGSSNIPRMGNPMEIARTALFLISDEASLLNGAIVTADGGWTSY